MYRPAVVQSHWECFLYVTDERFNELISQRFKENGVAVTTNRAAQNG